MTVLDAGQDLVAILTVICADLDGHRSKQDLPQDPRAYPALAHASIILLTAGGRAALAMRQHTQKT